MNVYVVETGEYEQRGILCVADSFGAAVDAVKRAYGPPYVVAWQDADACGLRGHFSAVLGYAMEHDADFSITEWPVDDQLD